MCRPQAVFHHVLQHGLQLQGVFFVFFVFVHKTVTNMAATHRQHGRCYHETLCWIEGICVMSWGLRWTVGEIKCKALMRNVQTQAQTWASVSPYADYNEGLIVLTGSGGRRVSEEGGGGGGREERRGGAATAVQSHSTSPPSGAGQIYSFCLCGEQSVITRRDGVTPALLVRWWMILIKGSDLLKSEISSYCLVVGAGKPRVAWLKTLQLLLNTARVV